MSGPAGPLRPELTAGPVAAPAAPAVAPAQSEARPGFRALLEKLERIARDAGPPAEVDDPDALRDAMRQVDDGFQQAMDLRRRLEEAFRQRLP